MSTLKMSGRIYNAMLKFANGTRSMPQFADLFFDNGKIYATDSYVICRWTPAAAYEVLDNSNGNIIEKFFFSPIIKVTAASKIYIDNTCIDISTESRMIDNPDRIVDDVQGDHPLNVIQGINPDYIAAIAALGKAVRADKCHSNGAIDFSWKGNVFNAHIDAGTNGYFDIVAMPQINKGKKE